MKNNIFVAGVIGFLLVTLVSCKQDNQLIDLHNGAANPDHLILDTFTIKTHTQKNDSVSAKNYSAYNLGASRSATYGQHTANMAMSFSLPDITGFNFPNDVKIDSVVLVLQYTPGDYNGNINTIHNLEIFEISEYLNPDSNYFSDFVTPIKSSPEATISTAFHPSDSVLHTLNGVTTKRAPQLRIKLNNATVGQTLANGNTHFTTNATFQNYFPGLFVRCKANTLLTGYGSFVRINHKGAYCGLLVYYNDSNEVLFPARTGNVIVNTTSANFSGTPIEAQFNGGDFNTTYLAPLSSTRIFIEIPSLSELANLSNSAVIAATISIPVDPALIESGYNPYSRALYFRQHYDGSITTIFDQAAEPKLFGGNYDESTHSYTFSFASELQTIINDRKAGKPERNRGFYLALPTDNPILATRSVMDTRKNAGQDGIRVRVTLIKTK